VNGVPLLTSAERLVITSDPQVALDKLLKKKPETPRDRLVLFAQTFVRFQVGCGAGDRMACRRFVVLITVEMRMLPQ
jgi:hypothetical protein